MKHILLLRLQKKSQFSYAIYKILSHEPVDFSHLLICRTGPSKCFIHLNGRSE